MSKVEVCSRHMGKINVTTRAGRPETVEFADVSGRGPAAGFATVDEDVAEVLLEIGLPDFWRPGAEHADEEPKVPVVPQKEDEDPGTGGEEGGKKEEGAGSGQGKEPPVTLSVDAYKSLKNVKELEAALEPCTDQAVLMELIAFEAQQEKTRQSWMAALNERLDALQKG